MSSDKAPTTSRPKVIHCSGHDPVSVNRRYQVGWCDVWIRWRSRGNRITYLGPTFVSRADTAAELWMAEDYQRKYPESDQTEDIEYNRKLLREADERGYAYDPPDTRNGIPTIQTAKDYIDRAEVEWLLRRFLAECYSLHHVRFKWERVKAKNAVMPFSFAGIERMNLDTDNHEPEVTSSAGA